MTKQKLLWEGLCCLVLTAFLMPCAAVGSNSTTSSVGAAQSTTSATLSASISPPAPPGKWQTFWIDRVKEFIAENATLDKDKRYIVFLGDSLTQGFRLKTYFPDLPVLNRGIVSDGVCDFPEGRLHWRGVTHRLDECVYNCRPSHLFFLI